MYYFDSVVGTVVLNDKLEVVEKGSKKDILKRFKGIKAVEEKQLPMVMQNLRKGLVISEFVDPITRDTKNKIRSAVKEDTLIIQAINNIDDITKVINMLGKRLREWYELYNPEFSQSISNHEKFVELIQRKTKKELLQEVGAKQTMGADLSEEDLEPIMDLAAEIGRLVKLQKKHERYIEKTMTRVAPNMTAVAGALIGARLLEHVGTIKRMVMLPASTIQLLGAEKALFRHIVTGARCPKFGVIYNHPLVTKAKNKGKTARHIADKISMAVRIDYFKGEFIGDKLRKGLEERAE